MNLIKMQGFFHPDDCRGRIHIIGCGAVGSTIAVNLARCGLTKITLYDDDVVDSHNLVNQMFRAKDVGKPKVEALADILAEINPDIMADIKLVNAKYENQPLSGYVFLCVDNIDVRREIVQKNKMNQSIKMLSDVRIRLTDAQHYMVKWSDSQMIQDLLNTMNFTHEEAMAETPMTACRTALSVCTTVWVICARAVSNFMNFVKSGGDTFSRTMMVDLSCPDFEAYGY